MKKKLIGYIIVSFYFLRCYVSYSMNKINFAEEVGNVKRYLQWHGNK